MYLNNDAVLLALERMKVKELQEVLKCANLKKKGRKADLQARSERANLASCMWRRA